MLAPFAPAWWLWVSSTLNTNLFGEGGPERRISVLGQMTAERPPCELGRPPATPSLTWLCLRVLTPVADRRRHRPVLAESLAGATLRAAIVDPLTFDGNLIQTRHRFLPSRPHPRLRRSP